MAKAVYFIENIGYYGLGFEYYIYFIFFIWCYFDVLAYCLLEFNFSYNDFYCVNKLCLEDQCSYIFKKECNVIIVECEFIKYK